MKLQLSATRSAILSFVIAGTLLLSSAGLAQNATENTLPFAEIWRKIAENSPGQRSADLEIHSAEQVETRAAHHWIPRFYVDGRVFTTNDPANAFISILGQRQLQAADFQPSDLNHPGTATFSRATVGVDFPVYEGGGRRAEHQSAQLLSAAKQSQKEALKNQEYARAFGSYGAILVFETAARDVEKLTREVQFERSQ